MSVKHTSSSLSQDMLQHMGAASAAWYNWGSRSRYIVSGVLCALLLTFIVWAAWAQVDEVSRGVGQVVPAQRLQRIQHLEGGILEDILVKEGEPVALDQIIARVDSVGAASIVRDTQTRILEHSAAITRIEAELQGEAPKFPEELQKQAPHLITAEQNTYDIRQRQIAEEEKILASQLEQKQQELNESVSRKNTFSSALALAEQRAQRMSALVQRKLYSELDYLNIQQEVVRLKGEMDALSNGISKLEGAIQESQQRKDLNQAVRHSELVKELNKRNSEIASLKENFVANTDRVTRTDLRSPVNGIVHRLLINTKGGIVKPGGEIMEIIPVDDSLVIEAKIRPADIAFIHPKQNAVVKISAYDHAIYGSLQGKVEHISADTITGPQNEVYYLVKIRTADNAITHNGQILPISPGMIANVDILTGKKSILSYITKPILRAQEGALRER